MAPDRTRRPGRWPAAAARLARRVALSAAWSAALSATLSASAAGPALAGPACGDRLPAGIRLQAEADGQRLVFQPQRWPVAVGRQIALDIVVCPGPQGAAPALLRVDAEMPAHRHGMNYRPSLRATGPDRYRAEGLLFHMPGRWALQFTLGNPAAPTRLAHPLDLE